MNRKQQMSRGTKSGLVLRILAAILLLPAGDALALPLAIYWRLRRDR